METKILQISTYHGGKKSLTKCKECSEDIPEFDMENHKRFHDREAGRGEYGSG